MAKRVIIDTDPGVDDCAAILLALASPELQVDALTVSYGNGSMARCADNAWRILAAAARTDIPVYPGAEGPLIRPPTAGWASHIHGGDALGAVVRPLNPEAGYLASNEPIVHFGLPEGAQMTGIRVLWPDGTRTSHPAPLPDTRITLHRPR